MSLHEQVDTDIEKDFSSKPAKIDDSFDFQVPSPSGSLMFLFFKKWTLETLMTLGIVLGLVIGTINETAVSTVSDIIGKDLESLGNNTWIAGGYTLTALAFCPIVGKLTDTFGRKSGVLLCNLIFVIGCLGCALAVNMPMFIAFRVIGGIGGGGLMALSYIMIADLTRATQRPLYYGIINTSFAIAAFLGPIVGRSLATQNWRIIFYIFIPICAVYSLIVIFILPLPTVQGGITNKLKHVDWLGCIIFILFIAGVNLLANWGGKDYTWNSVPIIVTTCLTLLFLSAFIYTELKVSINPILPPEMFTRNIISVNLANIFVGAINFIGISYFPIYYQTVQDYSPADSGYLIIPFLVLTGLICMLSGFIARHFNSGRETMWVGSVFQLIAVILLGVIPQSASVGQHVGYTIINAIGVGLIKQLVLMVSQRTSSKELVYIATGFTTFSHTFGRVIGLAIITRVYNYFYTKDIPSILLRFSPQDLSHPDIFDKLTPDQKSAIKHVSYIAFKDSYLCLIPFSVAAIVLLLFLTKWPSPVKQSQDTYQTK